MKENDKKNLVIFEINECDYDFILKGSKKFNYPLIYNFFRNKKKKITFTKDKVEGFNLDPWVQWVSIHTGLKSSQHKVFRMGQKLNSKFDQIWDRLKNKKIRFTLWGLFNSNIRTKNNIDLFYPDPWSFTQSAYPLKFDNFLKLPRYYALNYPNIIILKFILYFLLFFKNLLFSKSIFYFLKNINNFLYIFFKSKFKSYNFYFFLDLISLEIVLNHLQKKKSDFSIISLNSFAHYQHNYWDESKNHKFYFWYLNEMIKKITKIDDMYKSSICLNGFNQKRIKPRYHLRPKKPQIFLDKLNIKYKSIKPNMTTGAQVFFNNQKDKIKCIHILENINFNQKYFFNVQDYKDNNKIFYKFNIYSHKNIINFDRLDHKNFDELTYHSKYNKFNSKITVIKLILKSVKFTKSTSVHDNKGLIYLKNFKILKKKIQNIELYKYVIKHFI